MAILRAKKLKKKFYQPKQISILEGVDLEVFPGESVAITGRSGQGKSTLLHILGTLENPCSGTLEIANQKVSYFNRSKIRNRHIAFMFQSFHLLQDYTALENVLMPAQIGRYRKFDKREAEKRAFQLLDQVGLGGRAHFHTKLLSGGEKQRVAIARALCNDPDLLFADEPSGNLDSQTAAGIHELLLGLTHKGKSLVIVTHDAKLAQLCNKRYSLHEGRLEQV